MRHIVNTLRTRQNGRHFPDDILKWIFFNENVWISIEISLKFAPKGQINNIPALVQIMAWRRPGDKPLSETMMVSLLTHICVTRPQWVNGQHQRNWPAPFLSNALNLMLEHEAMPFLNINCHKLSNSILCGLFPYQDAGLPISILIINIRRSNVRFIYMMRLLYRDKRF